jgi:hypothetical protein
MAIRNSPRAFFIAILPLALLQGGLFASRLAGDMGAGLTVPSPDSALWLFVARFAIDAAALAAGHLLLRHLGLATRAAYGLMGGAAIALAYALAFRHALQLTAPLPGAVATSAIVPVIVGMISGFLYAQFAGRDFDEEVPLVPAPRWEGGEPVGKAVILPNPPPPGYDGPVLVRTSIAATVIAAAVPAVIVTVITLLVVMPGFASIFWDDKSAMAAQLAMPAQIFFITVFVMFVPAAVVVVATHVLARCFRLTGGPHYALIGAAVNCIAAVLLIAMVHAAFLFPAAAIIGAVMGAVYRRFAGLEPLPLPEAVLATDPRTLVPADHPSRRTRTVVMNG